MTTPDVTTRQDVENRVTQVLNRSDLAAYTAVWFVTAHRQIQRRHNFRCMEASAYEILVANQAAYCAPPDLKKPRLLKEVDASTLKLIQFFGETTIETINNRRLIANPPATATSNPNLDLLPIIFNDAAYAIWNGNIELDPAPGTGDANNRLQMDYYAWLNPPAENAFNWFTIHAFDYLVYRSLVEAEPFMRNDSRIDLWRGQAGEAWNDIFAADLEATTSGELVMRG